MAKKEEITYELLVLISSRWEAQGIYTAREQHTAVADAKSLEKVSTVKAVKVVKEFYDHKVGSSRSRTIYESAPKSPPQSKRAKRSSAAKSPSKPKSSSPPKPAKTATHKAKTGGGSLSDSMIAVPTAEPKARPSLLVTLVQILLALIVAVGAAMAVTQLASFGMRERSSIGFLARNDFLVIVFILVFSMTALAFVTRILSRLKGMKMPDRPALASSPPVRPVTVPLAPRPAGGKPLPPSAESLAAETLTPETEKKEETEPEKESEPEKEAEKESDPDIDLRAEMITMSAFTTSAVEVLADDTDSQDAHKVFGLVLFLVGAAQTLRHKKRFSEEMFQAMTNKTLGTLGLAKERSQHFVANIDEYLISNARYSQMFQQGRHGMAEFLEHGTGPRGVLADSLVDWEKPKGKAATSQPVTVLFTDIAGSTAMTQEMGDAGAQEVVHVHNAIVREAIQAFSGKEIKHTGDGIMASFPSASAGVEAASDMQHRTQSHNIDYPDLPLGLKIGLNTGEPISEDDDLFGTTVQLAARIVDKACAGQVLVSGSVYGLSQGKNLKFERFADLDMKGFDDPVTVYTAVWDPEAPRLIYTPPPVVLPQTDSEDSSVEEDSENA